ncbi:Tetratricopeptide repeat-containing protein [Mariniphaga anaerophila]|uniref:Tetratricopeptide repeat-containing protein n=1 Tax=Mariniphaga anaerophila TaxID=1484053 RepID=A0A1M4ZSB6_9BACT|nr:tetratricopeptide repeat protein [Mariniphaga anaerophila]SHF20963.1 Tetratricopeptide repeat-containing protein [Mariniphaga anaerophila]
MDGILFLLPEKSGKQKFILAEMTIKTIFTCLVLFMPICLKATDAIEQKIAEADSLLQISLEKTREVDPGGSIKYALEALSVIEKTGYSKGKAIAYFRIGDALYNLGNYKKALEYLTLAETENCSAKDPLVDSEISRVRGRTYGAMGLFDASVKKFKKGLKQIEKIKEPEKKDYLKTLAYENLAHIYKDMEVQDSVYAYLKKSSKLLQRMDEPFVFTSWINLYGSLGKYYSEKNKYDSAVYFFDQSLAMAKKYEFPYTSRTYQFRSELELKKGNLDSALYYSAKALNNVKDTHLDAELPSIYRKMEKIYEKKAINDSAKLYRGKALVAENELTKEHMDALDYAVNTIIEKETNATVVEAKKAIAFIFGGFFILILAAVVVLYTRKRKSKKIIREKEAEAKKLKQKLSGYSDEVIRLGKENDPTFVTKFQAVYPVFFQSLISKHPNLSSSDITLCAMIFLNFSSKDIAHYTYIEHRSVQTKKSRLRKKLGIDAKANLFLYLNSIAEPNDMQISPQTASSA